MGKMTFTNKDIMDREINMYKEENIRLKRIVNDLTKRLKVCEERV
jgi:hypothetical protein